MTKLSAVPAPKPEPMAAAMEAKRVLEMRLADLKAASELLDGALGDPGTHPHARAQAIRDWRDAWALYRAAEGR